jgi:NADPH:quinone reductase-like Zn-dependent oxidoreductase
VPRTVVRNQYDAVPADVCLPYAPHGSPQAARTVLLELATCFRFLFDDASDLLWGCA